MAEDYDIHLGTREVWGQHIPVGLYDHDCFQHAWINGGTGVGKTNLMFSMYSQIVRNGHGITLIDISGDLSNKAIAATPLSRKEDIVIYDPAEQDYVLPINFFYNVPEARRSVTASDFTEAAKHIFVESWGDRMDYILTKVVAALLDAPDYLKPTVLSIPLMLTNDRYRKEVVKHIKDDEVSRFFRDEFSVWPKQRREEYILPIHNKIGKLLANPMIRNSLCSHKPSYQFNTAISKKSILIIRLPKGPLGVSARLLGSMAVSTIINAAVEQDELPYDRRVPHFLLIDEFHNLLTQAPTSALSEVRKYKLSIIAATQFTDQINDIDPTMLSSMFGNIGSIIAFRSSETDADLFSKQLGKFQPHQYTDLGLGQARMRLLHHGQPDEPILAQTEIPDIPDKNYTKAHRAHVREKYMKPRDEIETTYARWKCKVLLDPEKRKKEQDRVKAAQRRKALKQIPLAGRSRAANTVTKRGEHAKQQIRSLLKSIPKQNQSTKTNRRRTRKQFY